MKNDMDKTTAIIVLVLIVGIIALSLCPTMSLFGILLAMLNGG